MIYLFAGDDAINKRKAYENFMKSLPKEVATFSVSRNDFDPMQIESFYSGAGLFFAKSAVIFQNIFEREEIRGFILYKLSLMGESKNDFIFLDARLNKTILDAFKKARAELNVFELPKEDKEKFNNFLLANAFGDRDKLNLWINYRRAIEKGVGMEELIGVLFWKAKDMVLKKNFGKWKAEELKNFVAKISYLLPEARKKGLDDEAAFEQFLLDVF
jgi:hypothetical protein